MKGFRDGRGGAGDPSGSIAGPLPPETKCENAAGVRDVASAGGGRPVNFAVRVRIHRSSVYIPSIEPRV